MDSDDYRPPTLSIADTTPSQRIGRNQPLSNGICPLCAPFAGGEYRSNGKARVVLESQLGTLNLDTRFNIFLLVANVHTLFDRYSWILLPDEPSIDQYYHTPSDIGDPELAVNRFAFPTFNGSEVFTYKLLPLPRKTKQLGITVQHRMQETTTPEDFTVHTYPFDDLPYARSHVRPHFVIFEAGMVLGRQPADFAVMLDNVQHHRSLRKVVGLYQAWTNDLPANVLEDTSFNPGSPGDSGEDDDSSDSERTKPRPKKRKHPHSPIKGSKRGKNLDKGASTGGTKNLALSHSIAAWQMTVVAGASEGCPDYCAYMAQCH